jgi:hypothetical protein
MQLRAQLSPSNPVRPLEDRAQINYRSFENCVQMPREPSGGQRALRRNALIYLDLGASVSDNILAIFRKLLNEEVFATASRVLSLFLSTKEDDA